MARAVPFFLQALAIALILAVVYLNIYTVPFGYYGLLKEAVLGFELPALKPGRHWLWTGFVPEKWELYLLPINPPPWEFELNHNLRYSEFLGLGKSGEIYLRLRLYVKLPEEALEEWLKLTGNEPHKFLEFAKSRLMILLKSKIYEWYQKEEDLRNLEMKIRNYFFYTENSPFLKDFQEIMLENQKLLLKLERFDFLELKIPDYGLYEKQSRNLEEIDTFRRLALREKLLAEVRVLEKQLKDKAEREHLEKLAELFNKYPALQSYLRNQNLLEKGIKIILPEVPEGKADKSQNPVSGGP